MVFIGRSVAICAKTNPKIPPQIKPPKTPSNVLFGEDSLNEILPYFLPIKYAPLSLATIVMISQTK